MNQLLNYFIQTEIILINSNKYETLTIYNLNQFAKINVSLIIHQNSYTLDHQSKRYVINSECKMQPIFEDGTVKTIVLFSKEKNGIQLSSSNRQLMNKLYYLLGRLISHKGFLDYYRVCQRLGRGTFATVYLVQHKNTKMLKAAKVFSKEGQKLQYKGKEALQHQIKILRQLDHPSVIKYDGLYETEGLIYLVTEYLSGGTLEDKIRSKFAHSAQDLLSIFRDVLQGLNYLNQKNIMHRDIKPENIICRSKNGRWVLSDFGLAAKIDEDYLHFGKCGTMGYIAPQIMNKTQNQVYSPICDVYSFGIIAYTLVVGCLPFRVQMQNFNDRKIVWEYFEKQECKQIPIDIIKFLKRLLQIDPSKRIKTHQALLSPIFQDENLEKSLEEYYNKRRQQRYNRILKIANN